VSPVKLCLTAAFTRANRVIPVASSRVDHHREELKMRVLTAFFVLCAIAFVAADDSKKDDPKKEETKLKGKWTAVSVKVAGKATPDGDVKHFKFTFEEKTFIHVVRGNVLEGEYSFDDSKSPKTIDLDIKKGRAEGKKQLAIFKIAGDKLTIVAAMPGEKDRPTSFKLEEGNSLIEGVFERDKP
jgi:uncharacterized protein (TIGR03067 family)